MLRATLKSLLARKLRLLLSGLAVVLGVMFVSGSFVLTDTLGRSFGDLISTTYEDVDVVVTGEEDAVAGGVAPTAPVPEPLVARVRALPETADAYGVIVTEGARAIDNRTGEVASTFGAPGIGYNWVPESDFFELRDGEGPDADHEIAINAELARIGGFEIGDRVTVLTREPGQDFTLVGVFGHPGDRDSLLGETAIAFTTPVAQELLYGEPVFTEIDVQAAGGVSAEELREAVAAEAGEEHRVQTGEEAAEEQTGQLDEALSFFNYILVGFGGVAAFVGIFLVLNTFSIIVAQRLRELALTRAIGASRRQVLGSVMLEALVIGLLGAVLGLLLGIGVGALLARAIGTIFGGLPVSGVVVPVTAVFVAFGVGLGVTLLAALLPAWRASRVAPVAALQESAIPDRPLTRLTVTGAVVTAAAGAVLAVSLLAQPEDLTLPLLLVGVLLTFIGVALLTPIFARPVAAVLGRLFSWSVPGKLGRRNSGRNPRRTAITAAALMIGVALVTGISTIFSSFSASVEEAVSADLRADLIIAGEQVSAMPPAFDPAVLEEARQLPGVATVAGLWVDFAEVDDGPAAVAAVDNLAAFRDITQLSPTAGGLDRLGSGELVISERTADELDLAVGDQLPITLPLGDPRGYTVVGVVEAGPLTPPFLISAEEAAEFRNPNPTQAYIQLRPDADSVAVRAALDRLLTDSPEVQVQVPSSFVEQQTRTFDQVLTFVQVLLVLAMVVAVLGVINTLVLSVFERTRELGLLRAIGLGRGATARMVTVESVVISLFGALLGIAVGVALGAAVTYGLREEGLTRLALPWGLMGAYLVAAGLVGVVAAVIPAIRAARLNVLAAIAYE